MNLQSSKMFIPSINRKNHTNDYFPIHHTVWITCQVCHRQFLYETENNSTVSNFICPSGCNNSNLNREGDGDDSKRFIKGNQIQ